MRVTPGEGANVGCPVVGAVGIEGGEVGRTVVGKVGSRVSKFFALATVGGSVKEVRVGYIEGSSVGLDVVVGDSVGTLLGGGVVGAAVGAVVGAVVG